MRKVFALLEKVAATDATVLIEGESGTGKELAASEIVRRGHRAQGPFVVIDCSAISPTIMESELFGHARGAFTGAERSRVGAFEAAHGGTVFLDEIGEMPAEMQAKLLRVLEAGEVRRVGENDPRPIDVRVIAATNRRLEQEVNRGRFREDLYFRLSVVTVHMPPLRSHLDDLELLVEVLLRAMGAEEQAQLFDAEALRAMRGHDWPGNVRELRNHIERTIVLGSVSAPHVEDSPPCGCADRTAPAHKIDLKVPLRLAKERIVADFERRYLVDLLEAHGDNVTRAARQAGIDRMHMYRLLQRHGLRDRALKT
jgi:DNA-binding NtrC family response regulator